MKLANKKSFGDYSQRMMQKKTAKAARISTEKEARKYFLKLMETPMAEF
jgi:hypothetical protein